MSIAPETQVRERLWNEWLRTPDGQDYVGWCNCVWCQALRARGHAWVETRMMAEKCPDREDAT